MASNNFGEVSWSDVPTDLGGSRTNNRDTYLRLEKGSNVVRVITPPFQYVVHKYKKEGDPGYGTKIGCAAANGPCPVCALGDKAKRRWLVGVIERKTQSYKILDMGLSVLKAIQTLNKDDEWGDPIRYDIDIKMDPNGGAANYYTVMPKIPKPLNAADVEIRDMVDLEDLKRRVQPLTVERCQERLDKALEGTPMRTAPVATQPERKRPAPAAKSAPVAVSSDDDDDDDLNFPSYDGKL